MNGIGLMFPQAPGGAIRPLGYRARGRGAQLLRSKAVALASEHMGQNMRSLV